MIVVVTAMHSEARPLIAYFNLKKNFRESRFEIFRNDEMVLIVSGIGKIRAAIATTFLLSKTDNIEQTIAINIGTCGAALNQTPGELFLIHKITDAGSGRRYYSDLLFRHNLPESGLTTFDRPLVRPQKTEPEWSLVDMEAAGFFEAAAKFLPADRILVLKVISDRLEMAGMTHEFIGRMMELNLDKFRQFFDNCRRKESKNGILSDQDRNLLDRITSDLRLTVTQQRQLTFLCKGFKIRTRKSLEFLQDFCQAPVNHKHQRDARFEELRKILIPA